MKQPKKKKRVVTKTKNKITRMGRKTAAVTSKKVETPRKTKTKVRSVYGATQGAANEQGHRPTYNTVTTNKVVAKKNKTKTTEREDILKKDSNGKLKRIKGQKTIIKTNKKTGKKKKTYKKK